MFNLTLSEFFDPRGRTDRRGIVAVSVVVLALELIGLAAGELVGAGMQAAWMAVLHGGFLWVALVAISRRLHDIGHSAWWIAGGFLLWLVWGFVIAMTAVLTLGPDAVEPGGTGMWVVMAVGLLPVLLVTIWLHFAGGVDGINRFGPAVEASGHVSEGGESLPTIPMARNAAS